MKEFRIVIQIEQCDQNGNAICTYGPEPIILLETDDADAAIHCLESTADELCLDIGDGLYGSREEV